VLFSGLNKNEEIKDFVTTHKAMDFDHIWALDEAGYKYNEYISKIFKVTSYSLDRNGKKFISSLEGRNYPFFLTQFHPEKIFDWNPKNKIDHHPMAIKANWEMGWFFVQEARKSRHKFESTREEKNYLIYRKKPKYTPRSMYEQVYSFPITKKRCLNQPEACSC
jgi:hypothetical protein